MASATSIDVVIPTFNCAKQLERCLDALNRQSVDCKLNLIVVDGGSNDDTVLTADRYGAQVYINPGQYATGLSGSRHFGEAKGDSEFIFNLDSDNFLAEEDALQSLLRPLLTDSSIQLSIPITTIDPKGGMVNQWLALLEQRQIKRMITTGIDEGRWVVIPDVDYGLTNAVLIRRRAVWECGGYDSDVRLLERLRRKGLSRGAIVRGAHFVHDQARTVRDYRTKWVRRLIRLSKLTESGLQDYFVEHPLRSTAEQSITIGLMRTVVTLPSASLLQFARTRERAWIFGLVYPLLLASITAAHPFATLRVSRGYLG